MEAQIRRATTADVDSLVVLRSTMFDAMGEPSAPQDSWRSSFATWVQRGLATKDLAAFVADHPTAGLVAGAMGQVNRHAPSPHNPVGLSGHVSNVITLPGWRRQGLARNCLDELMEWFRTSTEVRDINLSATVDGSGLYSNLGFAPREYPSMRLRIPR